MNKGSCDREAVALLACSALNSTEATRTQRHLQQCRECREYFREISEICAAQITAAQALPEAEASVRLHGRVAAVIRAGSRSWWDDGSGFVGAHRLEVAGLAAVLLLFVCGLALINHRSRSVPAPLAGAGDTPSSSMAEPKAVSFNLITYRLALNRSSEEFDRLLAHEAARPGFHRTTSLRPNSLWVDAGL